MARALAHGVFWSMLPSVAVLAASGLLIVLTARQAFPSRPERLVGD